MSGEIWPGIQREFPELNDRQRQAIGLTEGPLLIIAGPGSGKTLVLVIRALNLLLQGKAQPREMVLCTFTEKAAFELRDRIAMNAHKLGYAGDLSQLQAGTIHSLCNHYLRRYRHHTWLGHNYQVLGELTQALFLFDHFEAVVGPEQNGPYLGKWSTRWTAIQGLLELFNKITEELIDPQELITSSDVFLQQLGTAYGAYETQLQEKNCLDFAHQQKLFWELLHNPDIAAPIQEGISYLMVDEYQDTNYVQEQLLLRLAQPQNHLCVVGDEDQSLYRFRGATVRNILEFEQHFPGCARVALTVNYRSHQQIVAAYNQFMAASDWKNPNSDFNFRFDTVITHANRNLTRFHFFNSFLRFLYVGGINEYEDPDQPFPRGHVQVMTIHQAKGLEFPVVIAGSLAVNIGSPKQADRLLGNFYPRAPFEPENRITQFDRMRLHYVAFSRAEKLLVLASTEEPKPHFRTIWQGLPQWPYVRQDLLQALHFRLRNRMALKKSFSFTNDVKVYETCPRQYQFFRDYEFTPSRSAEIFFGSLVHQTIEDLHRWVLDGQAMRLIETAIPGLFEANFHSLVNAGYRPIDEAQRAIAYQQVINYFKQNQDRMGRILEIEVDVSVEKDDYILSGRIDLLLGEDEKLELLDFKSQPRPEADDARLEGYYQQLLIYAHILEQRYDRRPERLCLYWTGEEQRPDALMVFPYEPTRVAAAGTYFDQVVARILAEGFAVQQVPEARVCGECDFHSYCAKEGTIPG